MEYPAMRLIPGQAKEPAFAGFSGPNFTQVPDEIFDVLAPTLTEGELRVLLYIVRRTFGFRRSTDAISIQQMEHGIVTKDGRVLDRGTGMKRAAICRALHSLEAKGVVVVERGKAASGADDTNRYTLHLAEGEYLK